MREFGEEATREIALRIGRKNFLISRQVYEMIEVLMSTDERMM